MNTEKPLVRLIDDDPAVLQAMSFLLTVEGLDNKTFLSGESFLVEDAPSRAGVAVIDLKMPGMTGMELLKELKIRQFTHPVVILTAHGDIDLAVLALKSGAFDFLQKPLNPEKFLQSIHRALEMDGYENGSELEIVQRHYRDLSAREKQIVQRVSLGLTNKAIADELGLSDRTVESHRGSAYKKLKINNADDLKRLLAFLEAKEREQENNLSLLINKDI